MNQQQPPKELTDEALSKQFSFSFTRKEALILRTIILQKEYNIADARLIVPVLDKLEAAVMALTDQDYKNNEVKPPLNTN